MYTNLAAIPTYRLVAKSAYSSHLFAISPNGCLSLPTRHLAKRPRFVPGRARVVHPRRSPPASYTPFDRSRQAKVVTSWLASAAARWQCPLPTKHHERRPTTPSDLTKSPVGVARTARYARSSVTRPSPNVAPADYAGRTASTSSTHGFPAAENKHRHPTQLQFLALHRREMRRPPPLPTTPTLLSSQERHRRSCWSRASAPAASTRRI